MPEAGRQIDRGRVTEGESETRASECERERERNMARQREYPRRYGREVQHKQLVDAQFAYLEGHAQMTQEAGKPGPEHKRLRSVLARHQQVGLIVKVGGGCKGMPGRWALPLVQHQAPKVGANSSTLSYNSRARLRR